MKNKIKIAWWPILGAAVALIGVNLIGRYFGLTASLIGLIALLFAWWGAHSYYKKLLIRIEAKLNALPHSEREAFLSGIGDQIRKDIENRAKSRK